MWYGIFSRPEFHVDIDLNLYVDKKYMTLF